MTRAQTMTMMDMMERTAQRMTETSARTIPQFLLLRRNAGVVRSRPILHSRTMQLSRRTLSWSTLLNPAARVPRHRPSESAQQLVLAARRKALGTSMLMVGHERAVFKLLHAIFAVLLELVEKMKPTGEQQWAKLTAQYTQRTGVSGSCLVALAHRWFAATSQTAVAEKQFHNAGREEEADGSEKSCSFTLKFIPGNPKVVGHVQRARQIKGMIESDKSILQLGEQRKPKQTDNDQLMVDAAPPDADSVNAQAEPPCSPAPSSPAPSSASSSSSSSRSDSIPSSASSSSSSSSHSSASPLNSSPFFTGDLKDSRSVPTASKTNASPAIQSRKKVTSLLQQAVTVAKENAQTKTSLLERLVNSVAPSPQQRESLSRDVQELRSELVESRQETSDLRLAVAKLQQDFAAQATKTNNALELLLGWLLLVDAFILFLLQRSLFASHRIVCLVKLWYVERLRVARVEVWTVLLSQIELYCLATNFNERFDFQTNYFNEQTTSNVNCCKANKRHGANAFQSSSTIKRISRRGRVERFDSARSGASAPAASAASTAGASSAYQASTRSYSASSMTPSRQ